MQGNKLVPGGKNVLPRGAGLRAPHRRGRDRPFNQLNLLVYPNLEDSLGQGAILLVRWVLDSDVVWPSGARVLRGRIIHSDSLAAPDVQLWSGC